MFNYQCQIQSKCTRVISFVYSCDCCCLLAAWTFCLAPVSRSSSEMPFGSCTLPCFDNMIELHCFPCVRPASLQIFFYKQHFINNLPQMVGAFDIINPLEACNPAILCPRGQLHQTFSSPTIFVLKEKLKTSLYYAFLCAVGK